MSTIQDQIQSTQIALQDAQQQEQLAQDNFESLSNELSSTSTDSPTYAELQTSLQQATADYQAAQARTAQLQQNLAALQSSYNAASTQSSNPDQQQAIASDLYSQSADVYRNDTYDAVLNAVDSGQSSDTIDLLTNQAFDAEQSYQNSLTSASDSIGSYTSSIADSLGIGDPNGLTSTDLLNFDDPTAGDTTGAANQAPIVIDKVKTDNRLRIKPFVQSLADFVGSGTSQTQTSPNTAPGSLGVLEPLKDTNGVLFPYTPNITFTHRAQYSQMNPTHANTDYYLYMNTPAVTFQIQGQFTAQTDDEAKYLLAAMHFFRSATKMRFGSQDPDRGFGPPVLKMDGYGAMMFRSLPILILSFSMEMPNNVNYVSVTTSLGEQWVPSLATFNIECVVQQTPADQRDEFSWDDFASGKLLEGGKWI